MVHSNVAVTIQGLSKIYQLGDYKIRALDGINLEIFEEEFVIFMGPSGSGKSTLVNMIGGIDKPTTGTVSVNVGDKNLNLDKLGVRELTRYRRQYVGFVFQFYSLIPTLTAIENIELAGELIKIKRKDLISRAKELLELAGLKGRESAYPSQLSGGERQRVALVRAMVKHPRVLVVDEPTGQLDEKTGRNMVQLLKDFAKQSSATVIMVTHDEGLRSFADRLVHLSSGQITDDTR